MVKQPETIAKAFEQDALLADFARPLPNLLGGKRAPDASFKRVAQALSKSKRTASVQFTLGSASRARYWTVVMSPKGASASAGPAEKPTLEIVTDSASWTEIASGKLSPLEAFARGKLRVLGSIELARLVARSLSTSRRK
jgi:putative sterol carrier protein